MEGETCYCVSNLGRNTSARRQWRGSREWQGSEERDREKYVSEEAMEGDARWWVGNVMINTSAWKQWREDDVSEEVAEGGTCQLGGNIRINTSAPVKWRKEQVSEEAWICLICGYRLVWNSHCGDAYIKFTYLMLFCFTLCICRREDMVLCFMESNIIDE